MKIYLVWLRNNLACVCLTIEKAIEKVKELEFDYRKGAAWYTEEEAQ